MTMRRALKILVPVFAVVVVSFCGGGFTAKYDWFPYPQLVEPGFKAVRARLERRRAASAPAVKTNKWQKIDHSKSGVTLHDSERAFDGYTFHTSGHKSGAFLLDMEGQIVHEWEAAFRDVWPEASHVASPVPASNISWRRAHLFSDGSVLAMFTGAGDTPWGYGMVKLDADSNIVWRYPERTHHDVEVTDDHIYTLTHRFDSSHTELSEKYRHVGSTFLEDFLIELTPDGEESRRISILEAILDSEHASILAHSPRGHKWDPLHTNSVNYIDESFARHHEFAEKGQLLLSFRVLDALAILDLDRGEVVWTLRGGWKGQHDPDLLENGNILLFDNLGAPRPVGRTRILEVDPTDGSIVWSYEGTEDRPLYTHLRGSQDPVPNGNVLITESHQGRILEVTPEGDVVWEYYNPVREKSGGSTYLPVVTWAHRYPAEYVSSFVDVSGTAKDE